MSSNYFKSRCKLQKSNNIIEYIPPALRRHDGILTLLKILSKIVNSPANLNIL